MHTIFATVRWLNRDLASMRLYEKARSAFLEQIYHATKDTKDA